MADTLEEIILETLKYMDISLKNEDDIKNGIIRILEELLDGNYSIVPMEDNANKYINLYDKEKIINEIKRATKKDNYVLEDYANYMISYIRIHNINDNNINNINLSMMIDKLKIDNNLKNHLKKEVTKGNINALKGYIGDKVIEKYNNNKNSEYSFKK